MEEQKKKEDNENRNISDKKQSVIKIDFENIKKITFGDLLKIIVHTEIKVLALIIIIIIGYSISLIKTGQFLQIEKVGIPLDIPFKIDVNINNGDEFILSKNPSKPIVVEKGKNGVYIRKKEGSLGIYNEFGKLVTSKVKPASIGFGDIITLISQLGAQETFNWKGYKDRTDFTEIIRQDDTVVRTYSDGKKLEYKLDHNGQYISNTLRWIN